MLKFQSTNKAKMIVKYIKKCLSFLGVNVNRDKKFRIKLLIPGVEGGWNSYVGSFKYKNRGGENIS